MNYTIINKKFKNIQDLISFYSKDGLKIDLGCGFSKPTGFLGIDNLTGKNSQIQDHHNYPDLLMDLNSFSLPFPDNSCVEIRASHFLEHSNIDHIINEVFRLLKPKKFFLFAVPYANSAEGMYPGHNLFLTEKFFYENINFQEKFSIVKEEFFPSNNYLNLPYVIRLLLPFNFARIFLFNACNQMILTCITKK